MTQEELKIEYDKYRDKFDEIKQEIENKVKKTENYKGVFYEILPFSYQRGGFKRGKPIENINRLKSTNELFSYGFNSEGNIIEIREGISLEQQFYYQFLFYESDFVISLSFDNSKNLQNVCFYFFEKDNKVTKTYLKGKRGIRKEDYFYNKDGVLEKIVIKQFDKNGNEGDTLVHSFEYNPEGNLKSITKSAINNNDYSEVIYPPK